MEVIWRTPKERLTIDPATEVITDIWWEAEAYEGFAKASETGTVALPAPEPELLAEYMKQPTAEQAAIGATWESMADPSGFTRPEWVERDKLHPWLFAALGDEKDAIEARLIAAVRAKQKQQPPPANPVKTLETLQSKIDAARSDPPTEAGSGGVEEGAPDGLKAMLNEGEDLSDLEARVRISELLNVELAELRNLHGMAGEDLKRETEIETYLGVLARWGERP